MTKALTDILGRLNGDMLALNGMAAKYKQQEPPSNPTFEQADRAPASASNSSNYRGLSIYQEIAGRDPRSVRRRGCGDR